MPARQGEREGARERAQLLITNLDMLHRSFLPVHRQFAAFLRGLRHVIVDEGHYYRRARPRSAAGCLAPRGREQAVYVEPLCGCSLASTPCRPAGMLCCWCSACLARVSGDEALGRRHCPARPAQGCRASCMPTPCLRAGQGRVWVPCGAGAAAAAAAVRARVPGAARVCGHQRDHRQPAAARAGPAGCATAPGHRGKTRRCR
jgi:hypothetical protein